MPKNWQEILTRACYGPACVKAPEQWDNTIDRFLGTYDHDQHIAQVNHILFKWNLHQELHEDLKYLDEAIISTDFRTFRIQHKSCGRISTLPVKATHSYKIKCTECNFKVETKSTKRISDCRWQLLKTVYTTQRALRRAIPLHKDCGSCTLCPLQWKEAIIYLMWIHVGLQPLQNSQKPPRPLIMTSPLPICYCGITGTYDS